MDKFREDFKEEFEYLDWFYSLPLKERAILLSKSNINEGYLSPLKVFAPVASTAPIIFGNIPETSAIKSLRIISE